MAAQDLSTIVIAFDDQVAIGTPKSGSGATGLELLPSQGFDAQIAEVVTELINRSLMADSSRQGSEFYTWSGETELIVGATDKVLERVLGGTFAAAVTKTNADYGTLTISGTGTILTFGSSVLGWAIAGSSAQLAGMSVVGNNGKNFPIVSISADGLTITTVAGILVDNTSDAASSFIMAKTLFTATPYLRRDVTLEHYLADIDRSLRGSDFVFNGLTFTVQADKKVKLGISLGGCVLELLATGSSPNFTSPDFGTGESLFLLDGQIYFNGVKRVDLATVNWSLQSPVSGLPLISTRKSPKAFLGMFKLSGQFTGMVADGADFDSWKAEDRVQIFFNCVEQSSDSATANYRMFCLPNMRFGKWTMPASGEGAAIQTVQMNGGRDKRGTALGFPLSSVIVSGTT